MTFPGVLPLPRISSNYLPFSSIIYISFSFFYSDVSYFSSVALNTLNFMFVAATVLRVPYFPSKKSYFYIRLSFVPNTVSPKRATKTYFFKVVAISMLPSAFQQISSINSFPFGWDLKRKNGFFA